MQLVRVLMLSGVALPALAQYAGPAILSRGEAPAAMSAPEIKFRPFVEVAATYSTGLSGVAVTGAQGNLPDLTSYGGELAWGVSGMHSWKHTKIGLDYHGGLNYYAQQTGFSSISQAFLFGLTRQISRHITFTLRENAGMFTRAFGLGGLSQTVPFDPSQSYIPTTDFFDNRTYYLSSQADLKIQKTARLTFDLGGANFLTRYGAAGLVGSTGLTAHGDMQYRFNRRSTIGAAYNYQHFYYTGQFGSADVHSVFATYARALTARTEVSASVGVSHIEQTFIQSVPVDPVIAALLGVSATTEIGHLVNWTPAGTIRLSQVFHKGVAYVTVARGIFPGNGLFTTSYTDSVTSGYNYTGVRKWSLSVQGGYNRSRSVGNFQGLYNSMSGLVSASRQIARNIHFVAGFDVNRYDSPGFANYNRLIKDFRVGFGYTPGEVPLRIW